MVTLSQILILDTVLFDRPSPLCSSVPFLSAPIMPVMLLQGGHNMCLLGFPDNLSLYTVVYRGLPVDVAARRRLLLSIMTPYYI